MSAELNVDLREIGRLRAAEPTALFIADLRGRFGVPASRNLGAAAGIRRTSRWQNAAVDHRRAVPGLRSGGGGDEAEDRGWFAPRPSGNHQRLPSLMNENVYRVIHDATDPVTRTPSELSVIFRRPATPTTSDATTRKKRRPSPTEQSSHHPRVCGHRRAPQHHRRRDAPHREQRRQLRTTAEHLRRPHHAGPRAVVCRPARTRWRRSCAWPTRTA